MSARQHVSMSAKDDGQWTAMDSSGQWTVDSNSVHGGDGDTTCFARSLMGCVAGW